MALPDFFLFTVYAVVSAYLPLFLQVTGYTATQIGLLLGCFYAAGIVLPLVATPYVSKSGKLGLVLFISALAMAVLPVPLFRFRTIVCTAAVLAVYAAFYKFSVPLCDTMINASLGEHRDRYGRVRVFGSIGFVVMCLVMQKFVKVEKCTPLSMTLWMSIPALLFALSAVPSAFFGRGPAPESSDENSPAHAGFRDTVQSFSRDYYLMLFVMFTQFLGMVPSSSFISLYIKNELHSSASGVLWALSAICEIPFMFFSSFFLRKYKSEMLILIGTACVTVRMAFYAFIPNIAGAFLGQAMHSITFGLFYPSCVMFCARSASSHRALVTSMSFLTAAGGIATVIGSALGGWIIDTAGYKALFCIAGLVPLAGIGVYAAAKK